MKASKASAKLWKPWKISWHTRLTQLTKGEKKMVTHATDDLFKAYDLDGDGFITREEWLGTDAVFDALDVDHDGKLTPGRNWLWAWEPPSNWLEGGIQCL